MRVFRQCQQTLTSGEEAVVSKSSVMSIIKLIDFFGALLSKDSELSTVSSTIFFIVTDTERSVTIGAACAHFAEYVSFDIVSAFAFAGVH
jgi:hypothetical protein